MNSGTISMQDLSRQRRLKIDVGDGVIPSHTVGQAIEVPHLPVYPPLLEQEVTVLSPSLWQPGAEMSGLSRPSSVGPQLEKKVMVSLLEFKAPTAMKFLAAPGGAML